MARLHAETTERSLLVGLRVEVDVLRCACGSPPHGPAELTLQSSASVGVTPKKIKWAREPCVKKELTAHLRKKLAPLDVIDTIVDTDCVTSCQRLFSDCKAL